jgi:hypothetical protein
MKCRLRLHALANKEKYFDSEFILNNKNIIFIPINTYKLSDKNKEFSAIKWLALLLHIWEIQSSKLGLETGYCN